MRELKDLPLRLLYDFWTKVVQRGLPLPPRAAPVSLTVCVPPGLKTPYSKKESRVVNLRTSADVAFLCPRLDPHPESQQSWILQAIVWLRVAAMTEPCNSFRQQPAEALIHLKSENVGSPQFIYGFIQRMICNFTRIIDPIYGTLKW